MLVYLLRLLDNLVASFWNLEPNVYTQRNSMRVVIQVVKFFELPFFFSQKLRDGIHFWSGCQILATLSMWWASFQYLSPDNIHKEYISNDLKDLRFIQ